jgi:perosamine synthetase
MVGDKLINQMEPWYDEKEINAVTEYLKTGSWVTENKKTKELEQAICDYTGSKFCSILPNGTLTLWAALVVLGIGKGDKVIIPDYTMVATANAVRFAGAEPVFVDINRKNLCLDFKKTKKAISPKVKAIMLVSIGGRCPEIKDFVKLTKNKNIFLIEDAAQSFGSKINGKHLGTFGTFGSFSFSTPKIITMGQGGALVTDNEKLYKKLLAFKNFGREKSGMDEYKSLGCNLKVTDMQSVFGLEQLKKIDYRVNRKKEIFSLYKKLLKDVKEIEFIETSEETPPWFIDVLVSSPEKLAEYLKNNNIDARKFYPTLHNLPFYKKTGDFPVSKYVSKHGLWLPSSSQLSNEEISYICNKIKKYYGK